MPQKKKLPFVTVGFVAVNVLVYVILEILGNTENSEFMVRMGAVWPPYVKQGEYWRLFTATFMHFGFEHILNNMLVLICADSGEGDGAYQIPVSVSDRRCGRKYTVLCANDRTGKV